MANEETMKAKQAAMVEVVKAVRDVIRTLGTVPNGELYARLMGTMSLPVYQQIINILVEAGVVSEQDHLLTWVGPNGSVTKKLVVEVDASEWRNAHGGSPRGRGSWAFLIGGETVWVNGTYGEAKRQAVVVAESRGVSLVRVLS